ncbi:hypothetical protein QLQ12_42405 [Actinoplanes sp. NEAU-A12]|uniref:Integral membrane protein n=1 Tax=Actinoplanes sandaracinus TaxID=3045177 RepID=A0ABT6WZS4_9ACTN|nr:hypothetical protein [Actinoplanes sandaracinus]MDI6105256.1 hypothetical protein [Actinoplanes sandaracinus]
MFGRRRNPLWRGSDRFEAGMLLSLYVLFLIGAPVLAWWLAGASYRSEVRAAEWDRRNVFRVEAVLVTGPAEMRGPATAVPGLATATWTAPDGTPRSGPVGALAGQRAGDRVTIWVNHRGDGRAEPADRSPAGRAALVAILVMGAVAAVLNGVRRIGLALLARYRDRVWGREWLEVGPRWSRDRSP